MEDATKEVISILQYLLPGFLAAWVFYAFTSFQKPSQFERVVQALVFTLITQALVFVEEAMALRLGGIASIGSWTTRSDHLCSTVTAVFLGSTFAYFANNDKFHKIVRWFGITRETSYPSEWFGTFLTNVTYVVLHLKDERRLYGWPVEWPSQADKGHFVLKQVSWLDGENETRLANVDSVLIDVTEVKWVEFMTRTWEQDNGKEESQPAAANAVCGGKGNQRGQECQSFSTLQREATPTASATTTTAACQEMKGGAHAQASCQACAHNPHRASLDRGAQGSGQRAS